INNSGAELTSANTLALYAGGNVNVTTVENRRDFDVGSRNANAQGSSVEHITSLIDSKNLRIVSGGDTTIQGAKVNVANSASIKARRLNLLSAQNSSSYNSHEASKGLLTKSETDISRQITTQVGTNLNIGGKLTVDAKELTMLASNIKAKEADITTDILTLITAKDSEQSSVFSDGSGVLLREIKNQGKISEILQSSSIQVDDKLVLNGEDITEELSSDGLIKTLSSQNSIDNETIKLIKDKVNNKEWNDKITTLSSTGQLIVQAVVSYFTAGVGTGLVAAGEGAVQLAIDAALNSMINQATTEMATAALTGNDLDLDLKSITKNAVQAGVLSYANNLMTPEIANATKDSSRVVQSGANLVTQTATQTAVYGGNFEDNLRSNVLNEVSDRTFEAVGDVAFQEEVGNGIESFQDGGIAKTLLHASAGATVAAIKGEDIATGAVVTGARELLSPLTENATERGQLLMSQLTGTLVGQAVGGDEGAYSGSAIASSAEINNRQLHQREIDWIDGNAEAFADAKGISLEEARARLAQQALRGVDKAWSLILGTETDSVAKAFLDKNNANLFTVKDENEFKYGNTDGENKISKFNDEEYNSLKKFYGETAYTTTSTNLIGNRFLGEEYQKDAEKSIDDLEEQLSNLHIPNGEEVDSAIKAISKNLPNLPEQIVDGVVDMVEGAGIYAENVAPTTTQERMDELYGQGSTGSQTQANLATTDAIGTASMVVGGAGLVKGGADVVGDAFDKKVDDTLGELDGRLPSASGQGEVGIFGDNRQLEKLVESDAEIVINKEGRIEIQDSNGRILGQVDSDGTLRFKYDGYGGDIIMDPDKTTTFLGKFDDPICEGTGCQYFLGNKNKGIDSFPDGTFSRGSGEANRGGLNSLDVPEYDDIVKRHMEQEGVSDFDSLSVDAKKSVNDEFWREYNDPFLESAFREGDNIRLLSDKDNPNVVYGAYERELFRAEGKDDKIGLSDKYGFTFDEDSKSYIRLEKDFYQTSSGQ
ncbi:MAG: DUF637 domain-containing protein, partial [Epsilonproteobacteria bacterium]|nr:DUF637 domain-containing protein [Campylobacterota bacterium]